MFICRIPAFVLLLSLSPSALAGDYLVGEKGALFCKSLDDLKAQMSKAAAGGSGTIPGCGVLTPGAKLTSANVIQSDGYEGGMGTMPNGDVVTFLTPISTSGASSASVDENPDRVALDLVNATNVIRLSGLDLSAETRKWIGKIVETRASCFYADLNEFRCVASGFRIDLAQIQPRETREKLERECDTIGKSARRLCMVTLRFKYADYTRMDTGGYSGHLTVVRAAGNVAYVSK